MVMEFMIYPPQVLPRNRVEVRGFRQISLRIRGQLPRAYPTPRPFLAHPRLF
jgi:hypothetical protein